RIAIEPKLQLLRVATLKHLSNARGLVSAEGKVFVVHQRPRDNVPATQIAQGWVFTNAVSVVADGADAPSVLDDPRQSFADPCDVALSADGRLAFIACAGADSVLVVRTDKLNRAAKDGPYKEDLSQSRHYIVARIPTAANPRRLALSDDGKTLVVSNYLADS